MSSANGKKSHVVVVGGGFTGLVCAFRLLQSGYRVTVVEAHPEIGGLSASFDFGPFRWDRFYHCILTSDRALLGLLDELGLASEMRWTSTEVGLFSHDRLYKMSGPLDLLRFPHLSVFSKIRLVAATLYASHIRDGSALEKISLATWTKRLFGSTVYREIWEPLFRCKLGEMRHHASAAFLWGTLRRLYSTREKGPNKQEKLGYVRGGYATVLARLLHEVQARGGEVCTGVGVEQIRHVEGGRDTGCGPVEVCTTRGLLRCDAAVVTLPARALAAALDTHDGDYKAQLGEVRYLGLVCVVLVLRRRLSPFYVTNITTRVPFTGVIEMTNLIDPDVETGGFHLVYLPRYSDPKDALFNASEEEIWSAFEPEIKRMHPELEDEDIVKRFVFRERTVQPVPTLDYSRIAPPAQSPVPSVYVVNTAQIINNTLNNNVMTTLATDACERLMRDMPAHPVHP